MKINSSKLIGLLVLGFSNFIGNAQILNAELSSLNVGGNLAGLSVTPTVTIVNSGQTIINSFDVTLSYNGSQFTESVNGQSLISTEAMSLQLANSVDLVSGGNSMIVSISNVNGGSDDNISDNTISQLIDPIVPAAGKVVVIEEGTGTWCPYCPGGTVYMDSCEQWFGDFWIGIAVHNGDPMSVLEYDNGLGALLTNLPSSLIDRASEADPSVMANDFYQRIQVAPTALISNTSSWDPVTRQLEVTVTADFQSAASEGYKLAVALVENGVTGTSAGYAQANLFSGGGNGEMGGYENLPDPVPASQMVYDHVARAIQPSFTGDENVFPSIVNPGEQYTKTYSFNLPVEWNENNIKIVGMLIDPNGHIDNAGGSYLDAHLGSKELKESKGFKMYPNPTETAATVEMEVREPSKVKLRLFDMSGKELSSRDYGLVSTTSTVLINTSNLKAGVYFVEMRLNEKSMTKRLMVK